MLSQYIDNLESTIYWAQHQDDLDIYSLASRRMDQLLAYAQTLPTSQQILLQHKIDEVLPMEWPLWMEACRYQDSADTRSPSTALH